MQKHPAIVLALIVTLGSTLNRQEAQACSVDHVASAAEIVEGADAIVRAKAISSQGGDRYRGVVKFEIREVLKGQLEASVLALPGSTDHYDGRNDAPPPYKFVREGGRHGDCFAYDYKLGTEFLLFLKKGSPHWAPLAAVNEEVSGPDDPWVWWVKGYLARERAAVPVEKPVGR